MDPARAARGDSVRRHAPRTGSGGPVFHDVETVQFESLEPYEFVAQGDKVVVLGRSRPRMQSTGRVVDNDWVAVITVREGKLARYKIYEDTAALVSALQ